MKGKGELQKIPFKVIKEAATASYTKRSLIKLGIKLSAALGLWLLVIVAAQFCLSQIGLISREFDFNQYVWDQCTLWLSFVFGVFITIYGLLSDWR